MVLFFIAACAIAALVPILPLTACFLVFCPLFALRGSLQGGWKELYLGWLQSNLLPSENAVADMSVSVKSYLQKFYLDIVLILWSMLEWEGTP